MTDHITPEQARAHLATYSHEVTDLERQLLEMIAWARVEYAVAKREDGKLEFWSGECWEGDSYDAYWHTDPDDAKPEYDGEFLVSRLVIDLEEEK